VSISSKIEPISAGEREARLTGPVVVFKWAAIDGWPIEYVSPNVEEVFGFAPDLFASGELLYSDIIHPDDRKRVALECEQHLQSGVALSTHLHYRVVRADDEVIFVDEANRLVRGDDGEPSHYVGHVVDVTQRHQAEERLRRRKATLSEALEIAQLGYWEWDIENRRIHWSDEMFWMLGVEPGEIEPSLDAFCEFVHPDDVELVHEISRVTLAQLNPYNTIHRILRSSDGELRYLRGRGRVVSRDDDGRALRIVGTVQDITESVRAEEILRSERSWLLSLIEAMPGGVSFRDGEGRWLLANRYALDFLGLRGVDYQGKTAVELAEFSDNYRVAAWDCRETDDKAWRSAEPYSFEQEIPTREGELRTFDTIKVPVYEEDGSRKGLLVVARDITERKSTEEALKESKQRLAEAQRIAHLGSWHLDLDTGQVTWSEEVYRIYGVDADTFEQPLDLDFVLDSMPAADRERVRTASERTRATGESFQLEHDIIRQDGSLRIVHSEGRVECDDAEPRTMVGIIQDITERKKVEQLKEEFVSIVSHELRTPLTPITGVLAMLSNGSEVELSVRAQQMVDLALRNSYRLLYLVDDLLDIQKMSSGQMDFQMREIDLAEVVRESLRINASLEHQNNVKFVFDNRASKGCVRGDKGRLIQVMTNLLSNAAKFSPPNSVINIFLERTDSARMRVSVLDDGPGIAEDFRPRVFEKFAQADSSSTRKHGGTGLGLTISKSIIERLGGDIGFETELGEGTTFYFELTVSD
jgi:PAS domain S-box-containing protein